jgi:hypothetical protein
MDVPVTVYTVWSGPDGFRATNTAQPVIGSTTTYTSTVAVSSFGREQSGAYVCNATARSLSSLISDSDLQTGATTITTGTQYCCNYVDYGINKQLYSLGVYLSLNGAKYYTNSSIVTVAEIGQTDTYQNNALQCITDRKPCCGVPNPVGEWYFPNRTRVPILGSTTPYYRLRGDDGTVNLNRLISNVTHPTGQFCCVVPDTTNIIQTLCIYISKLPNFTVGRPLS